MFLIGIAMVAANARRGFAQAISSLVILPKGIASPLQIVGVVNDVRKLVQNLFGLPAQLVRDIAFDQSVFVKQALSTVLHEGSIGLVLTSIMILLFLGSMRATGAVLL